MPERGHRAHQHAHRVRVVVEAVDEPLAHVLVDERVAGDVALPLGQLRAVGQLTVEQQVGHLQVGALLGELLDRVAAVAQDAVVAVEVGDRALAGRGLQVGRVVDEERGIELRIADAGNTPPSIGTVTVLPVRSSVMVMVSGMFFPSATHVGSGAFLPGT